MRSTVKAPSDTSPSVSLEIPLAITLGSTSVDPLFSCSYVIPCDDAHVKLSSHDDESGSFATSSDFSSTIRPIFYYDDDIMEAITTHDFIYHPLHRNHTFEPHTPCGHYIDTLCFGKGAPIFEIPGEAILHNSPSASGSINSSIIILPHLVEPLESHITSYHSRDDIPCHSFLLHQQPNPLDIVINQPMGFLG